ncbi:flocculation protein FLO11-like [Lucilia sericata]|uniref:flocculation protein FLO11-like n=1 Tax=Lucilia sericata TaxID=13632 RepID=UPI0018A7F91B|nr:flocculation protein FLO11-like [Lucilia sericata]
MNFLSPDDIFSGVRRKSLCNGTLLTLTNKHQSESGSTTPSKSKKERRRGSFNEPTTNTSAKENGGRRASLVSRWFKHISDAAEQYKPRSKNANQEPVDDPAIATLPHSNTRESLELTPERPPPQSATATLITTPLAPMMPIPSVSQERSGFAQTNNNDVQLRNGRRESTPTSSSAPGDAYPPYYNIKQRLSHNELSPNINAVNRTMSTRSCGDANHNYSNTSPEFAGANGVTLRHTQSARQANGSTEEAAAAALAAAGVANKRDSASIVYSNNSNNTRTLMQSSPPLVEPTAIQISISPAHTAEPVLTPAEKLRRLDASIRDGLMEKQKIICDMFRLPVEHFHEIVDIATMPEAPKDSTDIALAAYAQVQSLTEVINDYMKVTPEQEVSAVSTAVCDKCHEKRENQPHSRTRSNVACGKAETKATTSTSSDIPPPLPPPNKQMAQAQQQTPAPSVTKMQTCALEDANIHEDDDGYCEIDELRLPALPPLTKTPTTATPPPLPPAVKASGAKQGSPPPPLPPPAGTFKTPPPPPPPPAKTLNQNSSIPAVAAATITSSSSASSTTNTTPELVKRQSTISADSIPEESADEVTHALNDHLHSKVEAHKSPEIKEDEEENEPENESATKEENEKTLEEPKTTATSFATENEQESEGVKTEPIAPIATIEDEDDKDEDSAMHTAECESAPLEENVVKEESSKKEDNDAKDVKDDAVNPIVTTTSMTAEPQRQNSNATQADEEISLNSEHIEINEAYECLSNINKLNTALSAMVDNSTQTLPLTTSLPVSTSTTIISTSNNTTSSSSSTNPNGHLPTLCGPNRIQHANSLEPSVPCHALSNIVSVLNNQISLLLPKINERDMERERLRKENQHLRELLNAMHERQRVEAKLETPSDITARAEVADDETDGFSPATSTTPTPTPTPTTANSAAALGEDQKESDNTTTTTTSSSATTNTVEAQN